MHRLNRIEVTTAYPFLLNIYHDYTAGKVSEEEFAEILRILENFMVRRFVCGVPTYGLNKVFPALYAQITAHAFVVDGLREVLRTKTIHGMRSFENGSSLPSCTRLASVSKRQRLSWSA